MNESEVIRAFYMEKNVDLEYHMYLQQCCGSGSVIILSGSRSSHQQAKKSKKNLDFLIKIQN
jgi:hypothetical protein